MRRSVPPEQYHSLHPILPSRIWEETGRAWEEADWEEARRVADSWEGLRWTDEWTDGNFPLFTIDLNTFSPLELLFNNSFINHSSLLVPSGASSPCSSSFSSSWLWFSLVHWSSSTPPRNWSKRPLMRVMKETQRQTWRTKKRLWRQLEKVQSRLRLVQVPVQYN